MNFIKGILFYWRILVKRLAVVTRFLHPRTPRHYIHIWFYYRATLYASAVLCLSVCLSITSRCCLKTAKRRVKQTTPHAHSFCFGLLLYRSASKMRYFVSSGTLHLTSTNRRTAASTEGLLLQSVLSVCPFGGRPRDVALVTMLNVDRGSAYSFENSVYRPTYI